MDTAPAPHARSKRHTVAGLASLGSCAAGIGVFLLCAWATSADAQGAVAFVVAAPVLLASAVGALVLARLARPWRGAAWAWRASIVCAALFLAFYASALVPQLRFISNGLIRGVALGFEALTGKTPYAADKGL